MNCYIGKEMMGRDSYERRNETHSIFTGIMDTKIRSYCNVACGMTDTVLDKQDKQLNKVLPKNSLRLFLDIN